MGRGIKDFREAGEYVQEEMWVKQQLPLIRGDWFYVDPYAGSNNRDGRTISTGLADILAAYNKCTSGRGDGICILSGGTTSTHTTSALTAVLDWTKYAITVFGVAAGGIKSRARIVASTASDLAYLIDVQGQNNRFYNIHVCNEGDAAGALGCLKVSGNRNLFVNSHFVGAGHVTPGAVALAAGGSLGAHDLNLNASENEFFGCTFGDNSVIRAGNNANIVLVAQQSKNSFKDCRTIKTSTTAGTGAIGLHVANTLNGWVTFDNCLFTCWYSNEYTTANTSLLIGAESTNEGLLMHNCGMVGWAEWDDAASSKMFMTNGAGAALGGVGIAAG